MRPAVHLLPQHKSRPESPDAATALETLKTGNLHYLMGCSTETERSRSAAQHPSATVVTCSYSCVSPGVITHTNSHGETFVVTSAGHLPGDTLLASINYGVVHLGTPAVFVVSHRCQRGGACRASYQDGKTLKGSKGTLEEVQALLDSKEVVFEELPVPDGKLPPGTLEHDLGTAKSLLAIPEIGDRVKNGTVMVVTAFYDDSTGQIWPTTKIFLPLPGDAVHPGEVVVQKVCQGNERFREIYRLYRKSSILEKTPLVAMVLACSDSREVPEIMFQAPYGSVEVVRNAGALADPNALRSLRLCHQQTGVKLLVIKPHSRCGAIEAARKERDEEKHEACDGSHLHLTRMIRPHLEANQWLEEHPLLPLTPENETMRNLQSLEAAKIHGVATIRDIMFSDNPDAIYLREQVENGKLRIVVGVARLGSGQVDFIENEDLKALEELRIERGVPSAAVGNA
jgi:carbonic anhydrase